MRKFVAKLYRIACEKIAMYAKEYVFHLLTFCLRQRNDTIFDRKFTYTDNKICSGDIILTMVWRVVVA